MSYTKLNLENGTVLDETHLAHMEDGIAAVSNWDVHTQINIAEELSEGFSITEVDGKPLKLREMWARVKLQNGSSSSTWVGCTVLLDRSDVALSGPTANRGGINSSTQGEFLYYMYHVWLTDTGVAFCDIWKGKTNEYSSHITITNPARQGKWTGVYSVNYITGIKCDNVLGAGTAQAAGTEIEIWGRNA